MRDFNFIGVDFIPNQSLTKKEENTAVKKYNIIMAKRNVAKTTDVIKVAELHL